MKFKKFKSKYLVSLDRGEEIVEMLKKFCTEQKINLGSITAIGATNHAKIGMFETKTKKYHMKEFKGDFEIASMVGNISTKNHEIYLHLHINIGDKNQNSFSGHLNYAIVSAAFEAIIDKIDGEADREFNEQIGLNMLKL